MLMFLEYTWLFIMLIVFRVHVVIYHVDVFRVQLVTMKRRVEY